MDEPIRTDEEHAAALAEIDCLMDADLEPDSAEGETLLLLVARVEAYERLRWPMP